MRPNVDIPWDIHGQIKEYAEENGQSIEESYKDLLKTGLKNTPDRSNQFRTDEQPDVHFTPLGGDSGVGDVVVFSNISPDIYTDPRVVRLKESNISTEEAESVLASFEKYFGSIEGSFSIHQENAAWFGDVSLGQFTHQLQNLGNLYRSVPADFEVSRHRAASAAFIGDVPHPAKNVIVYASPAHDDNIEKFGIEILLDGAPVDPTPYAEFAGEVGMTLSNAEPWVSNRGVSSDEADSVWDLQEVVEAAKREDVAEDGPIEIEQWLTESQGPQDDGETVTGVLCRNPFYQQPDTVGLGVSRLANQTALTDLERLYATMVHTVERDRQFELFVRRFSLLDLSEVTDAPFGIITINFTVNW